MSGTEALAAAQGAILIWMDERCITPGARAALQEASGGRSIVMTQDCEVAAPSLATVSYAIGDVPRELLDQMPELVWFHQFGTGAEWLDDHPASKARPFVLTNCSDDHCDVIADHALALLLGLTRRLPYFVSAQAKAQWAQVPLDAVDMVRLCDRTILIVGLGAIGHAIAKRLSPFGPRILGITRSGTSDGISGVELYRQSSLAAAARHADIAIACLPSTAQTRGMLDSAFFENLGPAAYFVNVGRGDTVDEDALVRALRHGTLAGAASDVFSQEPPDPSSPLWETPRLLVTPHSAACYQGVTNTWLSVGLDNLARIGSGRSLRNVVDKRVGY